VPAVMRVTLCRIWTVNVTETGRPASISSMPPFPSAPQAASAGAWRHERQRESDRTAASTASATRSSTGRFTFASVSHAWW
jgi:hypothetical protein